MALTAAVSRARSPRLDPLFQGAKFSGYDSDSAAGAESTGPLAVSNSMPQARLPFADRSANVIIAPAYSNTQAILLLASVNSAAL